MITIIALSIALSSLIPAYSVDVHIETVAQLAIEYAQEGLIVTASLEKNHLSHVLKKEGDCLPQDMLRVCADQYVQNNIQLMVNGKQVELAKQSQELTKESLIIAYKIDCIAPVQSIDIQSDYMIKYNDHAKVKVLSMLAEKNKVYSLSAKRKQITISL